MTRTRSTLTNAPQGCSALLGLSNCIRYVYLYDFWYIIYTLLFYLFWSYVTESKKKFTVLAYLLFSKKQNQKISKKSFSTKNDLQNFKDSKNTAVLEPRTGQFLRTWSFEAKDFKMCPRGLHLCKRNVTVELKNSWKLKTKCTLQNIVIIKFFYLVTLC